MTIQAFSAQNLSPFSRKTALLPFSPAAMPIEVHFLPPNVPCTYLNILISDASFQTDYELEPLYDDIFNGVVGVSWELSCATTSIPALSIPAALLAMRHLILLAVMADRSPSVWVSWPQPWMSASVSGASSGNVHGRSSNSVWRAVLLS